MPAESDHQSMLKLALLAGALLSCHPSQILERPEVETLDVLFIGNSLTYWNDLPAMVAALADSAGLPPLRYENISVGGASLEDHWNGGDAQARIAARSWDFVVLQQGPSALESSRVLLREYVRRFDERIRAGAGRTVVYMVWPDRSRSGDFPRVVESYTVAAADVGAVLVPGGAVWLEAWRRAPGLDFYDDSLHPNEAGSYAVAAAMLQRFYELDPGRLPASFRVGGQRVRIEPSAAKIIQESVRAVLDR